MIPLPPEQSADPEIASLITQMRDHHRSCAHCTSWEQAFGRRLPWRGFVRGCDWGESLADAYARTVTRGD